VLWIKSFCRPPRPFALDFDEISVSVGLMSWVQYSGIPSLAALMAIFCFSSGAMASGVVATADESSLVAAMKGGGAVTFAVNGTIYLTNTIVVSHDTVLDATGFKVAISGSNAVQIFIVNSNASLAMTNLTLENGVSQSTGYPSGGGAISNAGTLQVTGCAFISNSAVGISEPAGEAGEGDGGAVYNAGMVSALGCVFFGNSAVGGSGGPPDIFIFTAGAPANGGAVYNANLASFINCILSNNTASGGIGGVPEDGFPVSGASGGAANGGALCNVGSVVVSNNAFAQNIAIGGQGGQGGYEDPGGYQIPGGSGGSGGSAAGGGACCLGGSSVLINDSFWSNSAVGGAGGTGGAGENPSGLDRFAYGGNGGNGGSGGNAAGGAFCDLAASLLALNITAASNSITGGAAGAGGGPGGSSYPFVNPGSPGAAGLPGIAQGDSVGNLGGVVTLKNSILCPNALSDTNIFGAIVDAGNNIDSDMQNSLTNATSLNGVNPDLARLGNYGGPTPTMALLPGSPAIDAADSNDFPATDQRGVPRPFGPAPDIGAFESTYSTTISGVITGLMQGDQATIISGHEATQTTNGGGYSFVVDDASLSIWPTNANYVFAPPTQTLSLASNQTGVNFQAYRLNAIELVQTFDNSVNLAFAGTNGQSFRIEVSSNLSSWTPIATNTIGASGFLNASFPMTDVGGQYFRLVSP
jgi:hypothetical protein